MGLGETLQLAHNKKSYEPPGQVPAGWMEDSTSSQQYAQSDSRGQHQKAKGPDVRNKDSLNAVAGGFALKKEGLGPHRRDHQKEGCLPKAANLNSNPASNPLTLLEGIQSKLGIGPHWQPSLLEQSGNLWHFGPQS